MSASPNGGTGAHILVVDGDGGLLDRTRAVLEAAGFRVSTADMPDIGLVRRVGPDAIVLGLHFRGRATGLDFLEAHAADPATSAVPVVVHATAADLDGDQWQRLIGLAPPVLHPAGGPESGAAGLVDQIRASLALT